MTLGNAYWIIILVWLVFAGAARWPNWKTAGPDVLLFVLFVLLGWAEFGAPLHK